MKRDEASSSKSTSKCDGGLGDAAAMRQSLAKEGLTILVSWPNLNHENISGHFKRVDGLCNLINETVKCTFTGCVKKMIMIRDLMTRLERQLKWIGWGHNIILREFPRMTEAYYQDDMEGILSSLEKVKMENDNQASKIDAYFKLVDPLGEKSEIWNSHSIFGEWNSYLSKLKQDWKEKEVLIYVKKNKVLELRNKADTTRKSLFETGLISEKLLEDLKKFEDGGQYYSIIPEVLIDPTFSSLEDFYYSHFDVADGLFAQILKKCMPVEPAEFEKKEFAELLEILKDYTSLTCGSRISEEIIKMTHAFDIGDIDGLKSGMEGVKTGFEKLVNEVDNYFALMAQICRHEALDCWVKLKMHEIAEESSAEAASSGSDESNSEARTSGAHFSHYNLVKTGRLD